MSGKYRPLEDFMKKTPRHVTNTTLSLEQIELIIGTGLPRSAYRYRQWWANQKKNAKRPHAKAWMGAGFKVDKVNFPGGFVKFTRTLGLFGLTT